MNKTGKIVTVLAVILAVALGVLYGKGLMNVHHEARIPASLAVLTPQNPAKTAPDIGFTDAAGTRHALSALKGRWVLVNMWATWCAPCVAELPALAQLKSAVPGLTVIAVDLTHNDKPADSDKVLRAHHAGSLGAFADTDVAMMSAFTVAGLPTTVLIDPTGKVLYRAEGPAQWSAPESVDYFKDLVGS
jgi:thiol-disulfide isomerase/thioredoxin